jgi:imidazolonepropionase-like amidohydrolase
MPKINAQEYFPNNESIHSKTIIILHLQMPKFMSQIIENGVLLIQNGRVVAVGKQLLFKKILSQ